MDTNILNDWFYFYCQLGCVFFFQSSSCKGSLLITAAVLGTRTLANRGGSLHTGSASGFNALVFIMPQSTSWFAAFNQLINQNGYIHWWVTRTSLFINTLPSTWVLRRHMGIFPALYFLHPQWGCPRSSYNSSLFHWPC